MKFGRLQFGKLLLRKSCTTRERNICVQSKSTPFIQTQFQITLLQVIQKDLDLKEMQSSTYLTKLSTEELYALAEIHY